MGVGGQDLGGWGVGLRVEGVAHSESNSVRQLSEDAIKSVKKNHAHADEERVCLVPPCCLLLSGHILRGLAAAFAG